MFDYDDQRQIMILLGEATSLIEVLTVKLHNIELPETDYEILSLIDQSNIWTDRMNKLRNDLEKYHSEH